MKYKCLTIAGFDGSGGAGIQADLKTFSALGCYGMTVLTALPVQNTRGVKNCYPLPLQCIEEQLETLFEDIRPDCIKIGMLFSRDIIELVANFLERQAIGIPIVLDPVMVAKSGHPLLLPDAIETLKNKLIPRATIITPNLPEAYTLATPSSNLEELGRSLFNLGATAVLLKGGHADNEECHDLFIDQNNASVWLKAKRIKSNNTHGTGCTLSAAICAYLALGFPLLDACTKAKRYLTGAINASQHQSVGHGHGPVHHFYSIWPTLNHHSEEQLPWDY